MNLSRQASPQRSPLRLAAALYPQVFLLLGLSTSIACSRGDAAVPDANHRDRFIGLYNAGHLYDSGNYNAEFFLFGADGRCFYGKPSWRPDGSFDLAASAAKEPATACKFRRDGDNVVVTWQRNGDVHKYPIFRTKRGDLGFTDCDSFYPKYPSKVTRLTGRFESKTVTSLGGTPSQVQGTMSTTASAWNSQRLEFKSNGRFNYQTRGGASASTSAARSGGAVRVGNANTSSESTAEGSYRIHGNFMTLTFADGSTVQDIFDPETPDADPNKRGFFWGYNYYAPR
jgi:hypothetical protein